uniref:Uncharacterized protein n=1 Tax=Panagrolaimus sp. JU765 TaxID=591449 RepID=A0AC34R8W8_9BILA
MSVDSARNTLNYVAVNLKGPLKIQVVSYRFTPQMKNESLFWEPYNVTDDLLPRFKHQEFYGEEGTGNENDYHTLDFLRKYDFRLKQGECPQEVSASMVSLDCVHFFSVFYHGNEIYDLIGRPARKIPCRETKHRFLEGFEKNLMFLESGHCKNSMVKNKNFN